MTKRQTEKPRCFQRGFFWNLVSMPTQWNLQFAPLAFSIPRRFALGQDKSRSHGIVASLGALR